MRMKMSIDVVVAVAMDVGRATAGRRDWIGGVVRVDGGGRSQ